MTGASGGAACGRLGPNRWHFQHGPIDLIIDVEADADAGARAIADCWRQFQDVLPGLVQELPELRRPLRPRSALHGRAPLHGLMAPQGLAQTQGLAETQGPAMRGPVARRMLRACAPFADERFITPMAAVAGAVADELIAVFDRPGVTRACINNGGDIALLLSPGASYRVGICSELDGCAQFDGSTPYDGCARLDRSTRYDARAQLDGGAFASKGVPLSSVFTVHEDTPVRGIATSGWRGRSFSLGIADSVTVLAANAAAADAAATLIANAVNCDHAGIVRRPADQLKDDTDLGALRVTVDVPSLPAAAVAAALASGRAEAERWRDRGLIHAAAMVLQGKTELVLPRQVPPRRVLRRVLRREGGASAAESGAVVFEPAMFGVAVIEQAVTESAALEATSVEAAVVEAAVVEAAVVEAAVVETAAA